MTVDRQQNIGRNTISRAVEVAKIIGPFARKAVIFAGTTYLAHKALETRSNTGRQIGKPLSLDAQLQIVDSAVRNGNFTLGLSRWETIISFLLPKKRVANPAPIPDQPQDYADAMIRHDALQEYAQEDRANEFEKAYGEALPQHETYEHTNRTLFRRNRYQKRRKKG